MAANWWSKILTELTAVKLPAGHMILYPATSLHHVRPVTRGARVCSFFWIQSMIRDDGKRSLLFDLDTAIQRLNRGAGRTIPPRFSLPGCTTICFAGGPNSSRTNGMARRTELNLAARNTATIERILAGPGRRRQSGQSEASVGSAAQTRP